MPDSTSGTNDTSRYCIRYEVGFVREDSFGRDRNNILNNQERSCAKLRLRVLLTTAAQSSILHSSSAFFRDLDHLRKAKT